MRPDSAQSWLELARASGKIPGQNESAARVTFSDGRPGGGSARFPSRNWNRTVVSGSEYIRLDDWADGAGFNMKWAKTEGTITLSKSVRQTGC